MDIEKRLFELPEEIRVKRLKLLDLQEALEETEESIKLWETEQMQDINNSKDEKGKAIYSNETKRKAELERRKHTDKNYQDLLQIKKKQTREINELKIDVGILYDIQENLRAICRLESK